MTPDLSVFQTEDGELVQEQQQSLVASPHPVTLLATSNGTHIAVQVSFRHTHTVGVHKVIHKYYKKHTSSCLGGANGLPGSICRLKNGILCFR